MAEHKVHKGDRQSNFSTKAEKDVSHLNPISRGNHFSGECIEGGDCMCNRGHFRCLGHLDRNRHI